MPNPSVTILVCCYSGAKFFDETLKSVLAQDYDNFQVCFHDNGSEPEYQSRINEAALSVGGKIIRSEVNRYGEGVRFDVLQYIETKYVACIHDDDLYLPTKISTDVARMEQDGLDFVFGDKIFIDELGNEFHPEYDEINSRPFRVEDYPFQYIADLFYRGLRFHYSALMMKTKIAQQLVFGDPYLPRICDGLFVIRLLLDRHLRGAALTGRQSKIRVHGANDMLYGKFDRIRRGKEFMLLIHAEIFVFQDLLRLASDTELGRIFEIFPGIKVNNEDDRIAILVKAAIQLGEWQRSKKMMATSCIHEAFRINPMRTMSLMRQLTSSDANSFMKKTYDDYVQEEVRILSGLASLGVLNLTSGDLERLKAMSYAPVRRNVVSRIYKRNELAKECPGFDEDFYLRENPDVLKSGTRPLLHFLRHGWKEGRNPSAYFDVKGYLRENPDVAASGMNPLLHFIEYGWAEYRRGW